MEKQFLDEETDLKPFFVDEKKVGEVLGDIDAINQKIRLYFKEHPHAYETIFTPDKIKERATQEALAYLNLNEEKTNLDIVPSVLQSPEQRVKDEKALRIVEKYRDANLLMREEAHKKGAYLDERLIHIMYSHLFSGDEGVVQSLYSFRNSTFGGEPYVVGDVFDPVPNKDVPSRVSNLFFMYNNDWWDDHPVVKASKFFLEYYRIQPKMDGNKRTGLLCANFILESNGYPSIFIGENQKEELFGAIKTGLLTRDVSALTLLFAKNISASQAKIANDIRSYRLNIREREE